MTGYSSWTGRLSRAHLVSIPFMTIAALAHYLAQQIDGEVPDYPHVPKASDLPPVPKRVGQNVDWPIPPLAFTFHERLFGPTDPQEERDVAELLGLPTRTNDYDKSKPHNSVVIDIDVQIPDIYAWLNDPSQSLTALFTVYPKRQLAQDDRYDLGRGPWTAHRPQGSWPGPIVCARPQASSSSVARPSGYLAFSCSCGAMN